MQFLKLMMSQTLDTVPILKSTAEKEKRSFKTANNNAMTKGIIGGLTVWNGANNTTSKYQQHSYRPSTRSSSGRFTDNNKLLTAIALIALIFILSNFSYMSGVDAIPRCPAPGVETNEEPVDCRHGVTADYCGRKVCAKGPRQICGVGLFKLLGSCGEGLYCNCGRCTGCSLLTRRHA